MKEELVKEAKDKMLKTIEIANTISIVCMVSFLAVVAFIMVDKTLDTKDGIILLLVLGIVQLNIIHLLGYWKQKAIFNVSIALLRYIETNHPDIEMPPIHDDIEKH
jgi:hypothetical protein